MKYDTVNARELHGFLGVGRDFSNWIKARIAKFDFVEGVEYVTESQSPKPGSGNRGATIDYHISIVMAKQLSMFDDRYSVKEDVMRCELCNKVIQQNETAHGLKYGSVDVAQDIFLPAKDSATTVICSSCGTMLCKLIYSKLNYSTSSAKLPHQR